MFLSAAIIVRFKHFFWIIEVKRLLQARDKLSQNAFLHCYQQYHEDVSRNKKKISISQASADCLRNSFHLSWWLGMRDVYFDDLKIPWVNLPLAIDFPINRKQTVWHTSLALEIQMYDLDASQSKQRQSDKTEILRELKQRRSYWWDGFARTDSQIFQVPFQVVLIRKTKNCLLDDLLLFFCYKILSNIFVSALRYQLKELIKRIMRHFKMIVTLPSDAHARHSINNELSNLLISEFCDLFTIQLTQ